MSLFDKKPKKRPFYQPFGVARYKTKFGGLSKELSEGYAFTKMEDAPYIYWIKINCSRERIFSLFISLASLMGHPCMCVLEDHKEQPHKDYTAYITPMSVSIEAFNKYSFQLANDGFTGFGLASEKIEVKVDPHKEFDIYCNSLKEIKKYEADSKTYESFFKDIVETLNLTTEDKKIKY